MKWCCSHWKTQSRTVFCEWGKACRCCEAGKLIWVKDNEDAGERRYYIYSLRCISSSLEKKIVVWLMRTHLSINKKYITYLKSLQGDQAKRFKLTAAIFEWHLLWLHMHYFKSCYCTFLAKFPAPSDFKLAHCLICMVLSLFCSSNSRTIFTNTLTTLPQEGTLRFTACGLLPWSVLWPSHLATHSRESECEHVLSAKCGPRGLLNVVHDIDRPPDRLPSHWPQPRWVMFLAQGGKNGNSSCCTLSICMHCA